MHTRADQVRNTFAGVEAPNRNRLRKGAVCTAAPHSDGTVLSGVGNAPEHIRLFCQARGPVIRRVRAHRWTTLIRSGSPLPIT